MHGKNEVRIYTHDVKKGVQDLELTDKRKARILRPWSIFFEPPTHMSAGRSEHTSRRLTGRGPEGIN